MGRDCPDVEDTRPAAPSNLRFASATVEAIELEWDAAPDSGGGYEVTYEVVRSYDPGLGPDRIERKLFEVANPRLTDGGLFSGIEYCYTVRSVRSGQSSAGSVFGCESTLAADIAPPSTPVGVVADAKSSTVIALSWEEAMDDRGVDYYVIADLSDVDRSDDEVHVGRTNGTTFYVTGLNPDTEYCFGILSVDSAGNTSHTSREACATTFDDGGNNGEPTEPTESSCKEGAVLFAEDFESYEAGSLPADYVIVYNGLGDDEQRVEVEKGNRHLRTAGQLSWSLSMRKDFDFDLPDTVCVSWRMRVDNDLDRYGYTDNEGRKLAVFGSFAIKNSDELTAGVWIEKYESDKKIVASCRDGNHYELKLGEWTEFRLEVDFAAGRYRRYVIPILWTCPLGGAVGGRRPVFSIRAAIRVPALR